MSGNDCSLPRGGHYRYRVDNFGLFNSKQLCRSVWFFTIIWGTSGSLGTGVLLRFDCEPCCLPHGKSRHWVMQTNRRMCGLWWNFEEKGRGHFRRSVELSESRVIRRWARNLLQIHLFVSFLVSVSALQTCFRLHEPLPTSHFLLNYRKRLRTFLLDCCVICHQEIWDAS